MSYAISNRYRMCSRCLYDTTIPGILFDEHGVCNFCKIHDEMEKLYPLDDRGQRMLEDLAGKIKQRGKGKTYDCIVGVSGGRDSTYTLYTAVRLGLRPLAVHFDNGWDTEIAVTNIQRAISAYDIDLVTIVADWEEFKALQISFLKASTSDSEIPTDVAIHAVLQDVAAKEGIRYILIGHSFRTEGIVPVGWTYMDGRYLDGVHRHFGNSRITSFPNVTLSNVFYHQYIKGITVIPILNYVPYEKKEMGKFLERELGWIDYGGHHHESVYTEFFQSYLLPRKFKIDKRKLALSARVRSGEITREAAIEDIMSHPYPYNMDIVDYTIAKLGITREAFEAIMAAPLKCFHDYPTYSPLLKALKTPISWGFRSGMVPHILYYKYIANMPSKEDFEHTWQMHEEIEDVHDLLQMVVV